MTDEHTPEIEPENDNPDEAPAEVEPWTPPETLPAPEARASRPPVEAALAVLAVSIGCGVALWLSSQVFYVYIFYNALVGGALGWALGLAPRKAGFVNMPALVTGAVVFGVLPYVVMRVGFFVQLLPDLQAQGFDPSFFEFFVVFLENDKLFGIDIGLIGNVVVLLIEVGITVYYAYSKIVDAIAAARIESVPGEVIQFVVGGLAEGWDTPRLREELAARGWRSAEDQERAIGTGFDVIQAMQNPAA